MVKIDRDANAKQQFSLMLNVNTTTTKAYFNKEAICNIEKAFVKLSMHESTLNQAVLTENLLSRHKKKENDNYQDYNQSLASKRIPRKIY